ncbi:hypothetical protein NYE67_20475 [Solibacillus sp. FSL W8-0474]|uniref:hypothetical protein n=1 Tax=Solibacillus sp. FSL W8-0474 TaxID=2975336 RepID=UPI0030F69E5F
MAKAFEFADFVQEFWVDFIVFDKSPGYRNEVGKWIEGAETTRATGGIVLPLSDDDLRRMPNGIYTEKDWKLYTLEPLQVGQRMEYMGQSYTIEPSKDYSAYSDVFMYFAKGVVVN